MAEVAIGYNVDQAKKLMQDIADKYKDMGNKIKDNWDSVVTVLQQEWIGEDEQDYENELAERICTLYTNSYELANGCCKTIKETAEAWYKFQANNTISGEAAEGSGTVTIEDQEITKEDKIVEKKTKTFGNGDDRGLKSEGSADTIKTSINDYVTQIKTSATDLFSEVKSNNAFFGEQTTNIDNFIQSVGDAIAEVVVAVKDMYNALDTLAKSSYTTAVSDVGTKIDESKTTVETSVNDLGEAKWN